jgi:large subunit ribosomal protein L22
MNIKSHQKYVLTSPKKIREVVPMIKNLPPREAFDKLPFSGQRAGKILRKVIGTALANAKQKEVKEDSLYFKEIQITDGPILRRWRAGARGMAKPYKRRMSHIRIILGVKEEVAKDAEAKDKVLDRKKSNTEKTEKKSEVVNKRGKKKVSTKDAKKKK